MEYEIKIELPESVCVARVVTIDGRFSKVAVRLNDFPEIPLDSVPDLINSDPYFLFDSKKIWNSISIFRQSLSPMRIGMSLEKTEIDFEALKTCFMVLDWLRLYMIAPQAIDIEKMVFDEFILEKEPNSGTLKDIYFLPKEISLSKIHNLSEYFEKGLIGRLQIDPIHVKSHFIRLSLKEKINEIDSNVVLKFFPILSSRNDKLSKWARK